ncbi:zinc finger A20 and AN1 domain-containing stress-associated protein 3-like [Chenopodium quinoa]|uniref:zinc finger A20 and AN1 domain-containing stress-associated protein 3-like n=1 Tax=Chenopodium quinoa TaxID=63459 RepID=UPI000B76FBF5|nr:zinc finger A20 and AN1 domain-containing stress-associated protein 3-like [Chenopodium quinoa]
MAEEHGFQASEGLRLCANNCGFFGSSATLNLCSKCFRDVHMKEEQDALAKAALDSTNPVQSGSSTQSASFKLAGPATVDWTSAVETPTTMISTADVQAGHVAIPSTQPNRCLTCRKRVGLTGFKCRCGLMFCGSHRYPEQHGCTFDYKTMGKDAIAKANPLIKAEKLEKI